MADHMLKKYIAKVEKTIYVIETIEFVCEKESEAEEHLDNYCSSSGMYGNTVEVTETEIQEEECEGRWIESSEELGVDEFMKYKDELH